MLFHLPDSSSSIGWLLLPFPSGRGRQLPQHIFHAFPTHRYGQHPNLPSLDIRALPQLTGTGGLVA